MQPTMLLLIRVSGIALSIFGMVLWVMGMEGVLITVIGLLGFAVYAITDFAMNTGMRMAQKFASPRAYRVNMAFKIWGIFMMIGLGVMMIKPFVLSALLTWLAVGAVSIMFSVVLMWINMRKDMKEVVLPGLSSFATEVVNEFTKARS